MAPVLDGNRPPGPYAAGVDSRPVVPHGAVPDAVDLDKGPPRLLKARNNHAGRRCPLCDKRIYVGQLLVAERRGRVLSHAGCVSSQTNQMLNPDRLPPRPYGIRVAVTGGRHFADYAFLAARLAELEISVLAHGAAPGADSLAARWCRHTETPVRPYLADWAQHGTKAGPLRNRLMLDHFAPQLVVAFTGGIGTADCMHCARDRRIPVWQTWNQTTCPSPLTSTTG